MDSTGIFPLLELPDLVETTILEYLTVKEVISFRLVCHSTFDWVSRYTQPHLQKRLKDKTIYLGTDEDIHSFVTSVFHLPFTRFYFQFNPTKLSESEDIQQFMKRFSPFVIYLFVREMNMCLTDGELAFYESLTSLKSLRITVIKLHVPYEQYRRLSTESETLEAHSIWKSEVEKARIPQNPVKTLKKFTFSACCSSAYAYDFLRSCPNLKKFSQGKLSKDQEELRRLGRHGMKKMVEYFEERKSRGKFPFEFDFQHDPRGMGVPEDLTLAEDFLVCLGNAGARMINFHQHELSYLLEHTGISPREKLEKIFASIRSVTGISPRVKLVELPNLEELNFATDGDPADGNVFVKDWNESPTVHPQWPNLRKINGRVDKYGIWEDLENPEDFDSPPLDDVVQIAAMVDFLFRSPNKRTAVKEIDFTFGVDLEVPITPEHFVTNFPNLEILSLNVHSFTKQDYSNLFVLLGRDMKIKRLKLWTAVLFDDETFTGSSKSEEKTQVPYFSTMKHLENFKLLKCPSNDRVATGITDYFFTGVLAGMSLKSMKVTGHELNKVTWKGVEKLINGKFGETIQKFVVELADAPRSEEMTKCVEFLKKLSMRCEFNRRFREPKRRRFYCEYLNGNDV